MFKTKVRRNAAPPTSRFKRNSQTIIISCSVFSITDIYKVIWNKHQEGGIVYEFTENAY